MYIRIQPSSPPPRMNARAHTRTFLKPYFVGLARIDEQLEERENSEIAISLPFFTGSSDDFSLDFFFFFFFSTRPGINSWTVKFMGVLGDERNAGPVWIDARLTQYSFAITTGVRLRPVMRGGTLPFRERRSSRLCCAALLLRQFYIGREPTPVLIGTWLNARRRFRCPVIKSDSSISRSFLTIKVDLLVAILPPPPMRTRRLIKFQLRSLATIIHLYTHIYVLWFPRSLTFENSRFREKRWLSAG